MTPRDGTRPDGSPGNRVREGRARLPGAPAPGNSSPLPVAGSATGTHCGSAKRSTSAGGRRPAMTMTMTMTMTLP